MSRIDRVSTEFMRQMLEQMTLVDPGQRLRLELDTTQILPDSPSASAYGRVSLPEVVWNGADRPPEITWPSGGVVAFDHVVVWDATPEFIWRRGSGHCDLYIEQADETTAADSLDCSSSNGARWSDLMARIDDLIEEV